MQPMKQLTAIIGQSLQGAISRNFKKAAQRELQSKIDHKNEKIDLLKIGLSGIAKWYGFKTVHDFYKAFAAAKTANAKYQTKADKWEELYRENAQKQEKRKRIQMVTELSKEKCILAIKTNHTKKRQKNKITVSKNYRGENYILYFLSVFPLKTYCF